MKIENLKTIIKTGVAILSIATVTSVINCGIEKRKNKSLKKNVLDLEERLQRSEGTSENLETLNIGLTRSNNNLSYQLGKKEQELVEFRELIRKNNL